MDPCKPLSNRSICKLCCLRSPEWQFEGFFPSICTDTDQRSGKMVVLASTFQGSLRARRGSFQTKGEGVLGGGVGLGGVWGWGGVGVCGGCRLGGIGGGGGP